MQLTITIDEAQAKLKELIQQLVPGDEVVITEDQQPVARLVSEQRKTERPQRPGPELFKDVIVYMAPDFDALLDDMQGYMV
jgi:prevent-host-death family protein